MKTLIVAVAMIALLTGTAFSQKSGGNPGQVQLEQKQKDAKDTDKAYDKVMKSTGRKTDSLAPADPWENVRPAPASNSKKPN